MTAQGDDCYFFYYSTCAKGDECPFRHQPAALRNEVTCQQWEKGTCTRPVCNFRHMAIENHRSRTQCYWESQPSGCLKPFCSFLHTKPRPNNRPPVNAAARVPPVIHQAQPRPVAPVAPVRSVVPSSAGQQEMRMIPTISSPPRPRAPMQQNVSIPRQPALAAPIPYPAVTSRPMLVQQRPPHQMIRTPQFTGPPRPAVRQPVPAVAVRHPVPTGRGYAPVLSGVPVGFGRGIPAPQQWLMYAGRPEVPGSAMPFLPRTQIHEDKFDKQDSDSDSYSYSSSESEEERRRSHQTSHRRVRNSSHREVFNTSSRREVRSNRKQQSNKQSHERYRTGERRRPDGTRDKNKASTEAERERSRARRKPSKRSQREEDEERERKDSKEERKSSPLKDENTKEKDKDEKEDEEKEDKEKSNETNDTSSPGIKVKTLEEILREKALKKLEERRAQGKVEKEAKEGKVEEEPSVNDKDAEMTEEKESSIIEFDSNEKPPVTFDSKDNNSIESSTETSTTTRKVSSSDKRSPVKKVLNINKISVNNKDDSSVESSTEALTATKSISGDAEAEENKSTEEKASNEPPSPFQQVRVKSFEEIMLQKRKRRAEEEGGSRDSSEDVGEELTASVPGQVNSSTTAIPPKRLKRIVRKSSGDSDKDAKVVSSSGAESTVSKPARKRTVYVMDKASPSKDSRENGVTSTATKEDNKPQQITLKKAAVAERLGAQKVKVKSFQEIMAEKRQRASQENIEVQTSKEVVDAEEKRLDNVLGIIQQRKPVKTATAHVIKPRRIKVWTQGVSKLNVKEDSVSSSTTDVPPREQDESQDQAVPSDVETSSKLATCLQSEPTVAESLVNPGLTSMMDQLPITDQSIPVKDSYMNDAIPIVDANVRLHGFADDKIVVDSASKETEPSQDTTGMEQEPESTPSSPEKSPESPSDHLVIVDTDQPMEEQSTEPTESKEPPSYDEIKQAIANEMAKKDDFLGDFGADIDLGDEDGDVDEHWDLNEDDLLMELDEMINQ